MAFHQYNTDTYNTAQYNADVTAWVQLLTESIASADTRVESFAKALAETLTASVTVTEFMSTFKTESITLVDTVAKSIQNKVLTERIRLQDWISIKKSPASNIWSD